MVTFEIEQVMAWSPRLLAEVLRWSEPLGPGATNYSDFLDRVRQADVAHVADLANSRSKLELRYNQRLKKNEDVLPAVEKEVRGDLQA